MLAGCMARPEYHLALSDLESNLRPDLFNYILSILDYGKEDETKEDAESRASTRLKPIDLTCSFNSSDTSSIENKLFLHCGSVCNSSTNVARQLDQPSLRNNKRDETNMARRAGQLRQNKASLPSPSTRCSSLPVCRRILYKIPLNEPSARSRSCKTGTRARCIRKVNEEGRAEWGTLKTPYETLIGKIDQSEPPLFDRGRRVAKPERGVREFSNPITNPLYKIYNPKGYIQNDDEIAREFIFSIVNTFNEWLRSFDGQLVQLSPNVIIKILREDLQLPFDSHFFV